MKITRFNIRVYGILINSENKVLVTDELINGNEITKFPGGGLEFGEGTIDCLRREFIEECKNEIEVISHFYTTDFFQPSVYYPEHQIISIYYMVKPVYKFIISTKEKVFDFDERKNYAQTFRWIPLNQISGNDFTLPIDQLVGKMLKNRPR